jgi:hypothetical protein
MKIIAAVPFITSKKEFLETAGNFIQQWDQRVKEGTKYDFSHVFVIGTVHGQELKTLVLVKAETEADTMDTMKEEIMRELYQVKVSIVSGSPDELKTLNITRTMFGKWDEQIKQKIADQIGVSLEDMQEMFDADLALENLIKIVRDVNSGN